MKLGLIDFGDFHEHEILKMGVYDLFPDRPMKLVIRNSRVTKPGLIDFILDFRVDKMHTSYYSFSLNYD